MNQKPWHMFVIPGGATATKEGELSTYGPRILKQKWNIQDK